MKSKFLLSAFLFLAVLGFAQSPGDFDPSFGGIGYVTHGGPDYAQDPEIYLMADGRIVIGGFAVTSNTGGQYRIHRYHPNGDLDSSLHYDGILLISNPLFSDENSGHVTVQPDGKILIVGSIYSNSTSSIHIERFNVDGTPDLSFGSNGQAGLYLPEYRLNPSFIFPLANGQILVGGDYEDQYKPGYFAARFNDDGSVDPSYGFGGVCKALQGIGHILNVQKAALDASEGVIIMGDYADAVSEYHNRMVRFDADGHVDLQFGNNGIVDIPHLGFGDWSYGMTIGPAGEIYISGCGPSWWLGSMSLRKFSPNGVLDTNFGNQGLAEVSDGFADDMGMDVLVQPDGMIVVVGAAEGMPVDDRFFVARFHPDGTPEFGFGFGGIATPYMNQAGEFCEGYSGVLQPDGKILVGGTCMPSVSAAINGTSYVSKYTVARYHGGPVGESSTLFTSKDFEVFPNPAMNLAMVEVKADADETVDIVLMDAMGLPVKVPVARGYYVSGKAQQILDVSALTAGTYVIQVTAGGKTHQDRMVVLH
jgi:uncharacterized delta-60 repeat protein